MYVAHLYLRTFTIRTNLLCFIQLIEVGGLKGTKTCSTLTVGLVGKEGERIFALFRRLYAVHITLFLFSMC